MSCMVYGCRSHTSHKDIESSFISFHRFPQEDTIKQKWCELILQGRTWKKHCRICSKHFTRKCFINFNHKWRRLKPDAVPSLLIPTGRETQVKQSQAIMYQQTSIGQGVIVAPMDVKSEIEIPSTSSTCCLQLKARVSQLEQELEKLKKVSKRRLLKINTCKQNMRRLKNKNIHLFDRLTELLEQENVDLNAVKINKIIESFAKQHGDVTKIYNMELKKFAVTLHFLSPKAYGLVREELKDVLPDPKTIGTWYQGIGCDPGITSEALEAIKLRVKANKSLNNPGFISFFRKIILHIYQCYSTAK